MYSIWNDKPVLTKDLEEKNVICKCILYRNYKNAMLQKLEILMN